MHWQIQISHGRYVSDRQLILIRLFASLSNWKYGRKTSTEFGMNIRSIERKAREVTQTESLIKTNEELRKQVTELQDQLAKVTLRLNAYDSVGRPAAEHHVAEGSRSSMKLRPKNFVCWGCGSPDHPIRLCPNKTPEERRHDSWQVRHVREKRTRNCTRSRYKQRRNGNQHGNADGLSRRPDATKSVSESLPKVNAIDRSNEVSS